MIMYLKNQAGYKQRYFKDGKRVFKTSGKDVEPQQVMKESSRKSEGRRRKSLAIKRVREAQDEESTKKKKHEDDAEKEELRLSLKIVSDEDKDIDYEILDIKMLETFDRDDVLNLNRLVMEKFPNNDPAGYDLLLWGDLKVLVDPKEDDDIWKNQQEWKMIS
ncbi:hypothetical protein Tco_1385801 [Tanacetum coccineum]